MDDFKKATCRDYTAWDLNCRSICPHDRYDNRFEKKIKRKARRKYKQKLKIMYWQILKCMLYYKYNKAKG